MLDTIFLPNQDANESSYAYVLMSNTAEPELLVLWSEEKDKILV